MIANELRNIADFIEGRRAHASELEFISCIEADGLGVIPISDQKNKKLQNAVFINEYELQRLSITEDTWIASGFNTYVVRKKE